MGLVELLQTPEKGLEGQSWLGGTWSSLTSNLVELFIPCAKRLYVMGGDKRFVVGNGAAWLWCWPSASWACVAKGE